jgi:CheY-like chemotaxis protein
VTDARGGNLDEAPGEVATILVVEDNEAVRDLVHVALGNRRERILVAASGEEAIAVSAGSRIDLLITDVVLPQLSGPDLASALRVEQPWLKLIYLSGWFDHSSFPSLLDGVLLTKPFPLDDLRDAVAATLDGPRHRDQAT